MAKIATAILELRTDDAAFGAGLDKASQKVKAFGVDIDLQSKALATFGKVLAGAFTVTAIAGAAKQFIDFGGELTDLAVKTGMSTDAIQKLDLAFGQNGVTLDQVVSASNRLSKSLLDGDKSTVAALEKMGFTVKDLVAMSPEQQFLEVADAIGQIENPTERAWVAMQIFGKGGAELLPGLTGNLKETTEEFERMGLIIDQQTLEAADAFGDQIGLMGRQLMGIVATVVGPLLPALSALGTTLSWIGANVIGPVLNTAVKSAMTLLAGFWEVVSGLLAKLADLGSKLPGVGGKFAEMSAWLKESSQSAGAYMQSLWKETDNVKASTTAAAPALAGFGRVTGDAGKEAKKAAAETKRLAEEAARLRDQILLLNLKNASPLVQQIYDPAAGELPGLAKLKAFVGILDQVRTVEAGIGKRGALGLEELGKALQNAAPSQRTLGDSLKAAMSGDFGSVFKDVSGFFQKGAGQVGVGFLRGIGDMLTGGLSGLLSSGVGLLGKGVSKLLGGLFDSEGKEANRMRDQFIATFDAMGRQGLDVLRERAAAAGIPLDNLLNANKPREMQAAIEELSAALQFQDEAMQVLAETTQRYGFTLEELGPAFARQELDKQAQQLWKDFQVLTSAGIETDTVLGKMGDSINQFVADALRTGTEIPAAMAPMLQRMVEMGQLTDENGDVIDDLEQAGVSFSMTMSQGFQSLIGEVKKLTDAIARGLGLAIQNIPQPVIQGRVSWAVDAPPGVSIETGEGTGAPIPMARGGFGEVTRPTLFLAGEAGPEQFAFSGAHRAFAGGDTGAIEARLASIDANQAEQTRYQKTSLARDLARAVVGQMQYVTAVI